MFLDGVHFFLSYAVPHLPSLTTISQIEKVEETEMPDRMGVEEGNILTDYSAGEESNKPKDDKSLAVEQKSYQLVVLC